jgi:cellulose synthase/poly-beta-1,6-N-acetylglucosamine synthase-like glycosyltransferase
MTKLRSRLETASVLSVIIPVYNEAQTIGRTLQQVVGAVPETP